MSSGMKESKKTDSSKTARDPVCGMTVDKDTAIKRKIGDRWYYFCSQQCADVYEAPRTRTQSHETQSNPHPISGNISS